MGAYDRRSILLGSVGIVGGVGVLASCDSKGDKKDPAREVDAGDASAPVEMSATDIVPVLVAVAERMIPKDELGPGAKDAGAQPYFEWVLADPRMKSIKSMITRGAVWLNGASRKENNVAFYDLDPARQDELMIRLADNKVRPKGFTPNAFMRVMLALTLEAFLGDPKYGGNKGEVGWKTIGGVDWSGRKAGGDEGKNK